MKNIETINMLKYEQKTWKQYCKERQDIDKIYLLVSRTARWVEEKRNEMEIQLCEKKREGRDLPTFLSPPLIKFMHFNWSKLNFAFSFFSFLFLFVFIYFFFDLFLFILFIYFSFYLCGSFGLLLFYWESITCQQVFINAIYIPWL